ncbi:hypothetical protein SAMN05421541_109493 [Actinoplanes philippinensis]|uniref:DUF7674 domain-containing protein n=1 Tax=Actinoplanes philippinensis TaxID=35752 RepID=A0A1I2IAE3_9ACTN|nr:hypothetical protein [Actinoplanes philippinensis]SFF39245.1 hypothetical protein SAMN05421541_109493 [Actinoplanes philippinensis]
MTDGRSPTYLGFRDYLWDVLPEAREHILTEELYQVGDGGEIDLTAYRYMSNAFRQVMEDAAGNGDRDLVRRCIALIETMLASGDRNLVDVVQIRVIEKTGHTPGLTDLVRAYAGPLTWPRMANTEGLPGPAAPGPAEAPVADGRPGPEAAAVRSWLWERVPSVRYFVILTEREETRATMSLSAMTAQRYVAEAIVREMGQDALEHALGSGDPRPTEQFAATLELLLAEPGLVALVRSQAAEIVAAADRNPLLREHAAPGLQKLLGDQEPQPDSVRVRLEDLG